jgi:hypothetical protein
MGDDRLDFCRGEQIDQRTMNDDERLLAPHGKGVGIGGGVLADVELGRVNVENATGIEEALVQLRQLGGADEDAGGEVLEVEDLFRRGADQSSDQQVKTGDLAQGLGRLAIEGVAEGVGLESGDRGFGGHEPLVEEELVLL